jgi:hypothetical protein
LLKKQPAALAERPASKSDQHHHRRLGREETSPRKPRKLNYSPADARPAPPEDDFDFFRRHPDAAIRIRFPFENEFSAADLAEGGGLACYVRAIVERNPGRPIRRARWLLFVRGGHA